MAGMVLRGAGALLASLVLMIGSGIASANRADDFKFASDKTGCRSIPFDTRGECIARDGDQQRSCREITCSRSDYDHKRARYKDTEVRLHSARRGNNEAEVRSLERELKVLADALKKQRAEAHKRVPDAQECTDSHSHLKSIFENARSSVGREHDPALKPYVDHLASLYTTEVGKQSKATELAKSQLEQCSYINSTPW